MNSFKNMIWGIVFVILGLLIGLKSFGILNINFFFDGWWTLFIIIPSIIGLFTDDDKTGSIVWIVVGLLLFLTCQDVLSFETMWKLLVPIILILIGCSLIFKNVIGKKINEKINELNANNKDGNTLTATFSGIKENYDNRELNNLNLNSIFGGIELDLTNAKVKQDVVINASAIFGGIDIKVPKNVNVEVSSNSLFGGFDNKIKNKEDNKVTIYVKGTCIFGGVDIK